MTTVISATSWVPRGFAAELPQKVEFDEAEMERISEMAKLKLDEAQEDLAEAEEDAAADGSPQDSGANELSISQKSRIASLAQESDSDADEEVEKVDLNDDDLKEYNMDTYDDEPNGQGERMGMFGYTENLTYYKSGEEDPYVSLAALKEQEEEDLENYRIDADDNLILATKTEDDVSMLQVYVYSDDNEAVQGDGSGLYVHHEVMLPAFPLCVEWMDFKVGKNNDGESGNFAAVGTFEPEIEVWNLDSVDAMFPDLILGQRPDNAPEPKIKPKKGKKGSKPHFYVNDEYHVDAVLSLAHNRLHRNLLASGSADTTIKLWDLTQGVCSSSLTTHSGKVSSVAWNPAEGTVLLSSGYDQKAIVSDLRSTDAKKVFDIRNDAESVKWKTNGVNFYVSDDNGRIFYFDARQEGKPVWTLQAHDSEVTSFDLNQFIDDFMVTCSTDRTVKLWDLHGSPSMIISRDMDVGKAFSVSFAPDKELAGHVVLSGTASAVKVWDTLSNRTVREKMSKYIDGYKPRSGERIATIVDDAGSDEEYEMGE